jgi:serine/threonine protein phosphatase PrpC
VVVTQGAAAADPAAGGTTGNGTAGNDTAADGTAGNGTTADDTTADDTTGNGTTADDTTGNGTAANDTAGDDTAGNDTAGHGSAGPAGRVCPSCGRPVRARDNFCEACRAELAPAVVSTGQPGFAASCPACGGSQVSQDGYCESCGNRAPAGRDHTEHDLMLVAGVSDRGLRHHRNEDALALALATAALAAGPVAVAVVSDGVSSSERADEASLAVVRAAVDVLLAAVRGGGDLTEASREAVSAARRALATLPGEGAPPAGAPGAPPAGAPGPAPAGEGHGGNAAAATYVSAVVTGDAVTVCWLGDSRAYWLGSGDGASAQRLTRDDSLGEEMVEAGLISEADVASLPQGHVVTGWVGCDLPDAVPHVTRFEPPGPGAVLLCSDGLWNYQPDADQLAALALPGALTQPRAAAAALVKFALDAGGRDNVTAVLAPFPPHRPAQATPAHAAPAHAAPAQAAPAHAADSAVGTPAARSLPAGTPASDAPDPAPPADQNQGELR